MNVPRTPSVRPSVQRCGERAAGAHKVYKRNDHSRRRRSRYSRPWRRSRRGRSRQRRNRPGEAPVMVVSGWGGMEAWWWWRGLLTRGVEAARARGAATARRRPARIVIDLCVWVVGRKENGEISVGGLYGGGAFERLKREGCAALLWLGRIRVGKGEDGQLPREATSQWMMQLARGVKGLVGEGEGRGKATNEDDEE